MFKEVANGSDGGDLLLQVHGCQKIGKLVYSTISCDDTMHNRDIHHERHSS